MQDLHSHYGRYPPSSQKILISEKISVVICPRCAPTEGEYADFESIKEDLPEKIEGKPYRLMHRDHNNAINMFILGITHILRGERPQEFSRPPKNGERFSNGSSRRHSRGQGLPPFPSLTRTPHAHTSPCNPRNFVDIS